MSGSDATVPIGPAAYSSWRATSVGSITEGIEQRMILELLGDLPGRRVLDVGCGDGALACVLASRGADIVGIDPDPAMLVDARSRAALAGVRATFLDGQVEQLPFPDGSVDVVVSVTALCFVPDAAGAVREMARVLRLGGRLVLGELARWSLSAAIPRVRGWLGAATWRAARFRSAAGLRALAEQAGLSVTSVRGAVYYPPLGLPARMLARLDPWLGRTTTVGAAFVALCAMKPEQSPSR